MGAACERLRAGSGGHGAAGGAEFDRAGSSLSARHNNDDDGDGDDSTLIRPGVRQVSCASSAARNPRAGASTRKLKRTGPRRIGRLASVIVLVVLVPLFGLIVRMEAEASAHQNSQDTTTQETSQAEDANQPTNDDSRAWRKFARSSSDKANSIGSTNARPTTASGQPNQGVTVLADRRPRLRRSPLDRKRHQLEQAGALKQAPDVTRVVAISGQTIEFQCPLAMELLAQGQDTRHTIEWRKDGHQLNQMNSTRFRLAQTSSSSSLTILEAQPRTDESTFECALVPIEPAERAAGERASKVHQFQLKLLVAPRLAPFEFPHDVQVGMRVLLTCSALEGQQPISFVWLKDNQIITGQPHGGGGGSGSARHHQLASSRKNEALGSGAGGGGGGGGGDDDDELDEDEVAARDQDQAAPSSLAQFHQQQLADKFALSAHAPVALGERKSEYVLIQPARPPNETQLELAADSSGTLQATGATVTSATAATTTNDASPDRRPAAKQRKGPTSMQLLDASIKVRQADDYSILSIDSIELKHSGRYTCSAQNEAARTSHSSQLLINAPPQLTREPQDGDLVSGQSLVVECAASGQPRPTLSWLRARESNGGKQLDLVPIYENLRYSILPNGSLAIANVTQREQGFYMCAAKNGFAPEASKLIKLTVHEPARVATRYKLLESRADERAQLTCSASGEQPIALSWLDKEGKPIDHKSSDKRFIIDVADPQRAPPSDTRNASHLAESSLFITRTVRADSGHYTCVAANKFGEDKMVTNLLVQDAPDKLLELKVTNVTSTTISLRWQLGFTGNAPVGSYLVQYQSDDPLDDLLLMSSSSSPSSSGATQTSGSQTSTMAPQTQSTRLSHEQLFSLLLASQTDSLTEGATGSTSGSTSNNNINNNIINNNNNNNNKLQTTSQLKATLDLLNSLASSTPANASQLDALSATSAADEAIDRTLVELTVEQTATSLVVKDLSPFCVYRLRLAAINKIGLGEFSDWIRAKTEEAPPSGSALKIAATATGPNSIKLSWLPPERRAWNGQLVRFQIGYRPIDSTFELSKSLDWSPNTLMQSIMLGANNKSIGVAAAAAPATAPATAVAATSTGSKSGATDKGSSSLALRQHLRQLLAQQQQELVAHLTNLQRSTTYLIWIQAVNGRGAGPQSHVISVKTLDDVPPSAPALRVHSTSANAITIAWSMMSNFVSAANHYSLFYRRVPPPSQLVHAGHYFARTTGSNFTAAPFAPTDSNLHQQTFSEPGAFLERTISSQQLMTADLEPAYGQRKSPFNQQQHQQQSAQTSQHYQQFVYTLDQLDCGSVYELYMTTRNSVGKSEPSPVVTTRTSGEPPLAPHNKNHLFARIGAQDVLLNLASWSTGGCPLTHVAVRYKQTPQPQASSLAHPNSSLATPSSGSPLSSVAQGPNFSIGWPVSASVPANMLATINAQDRAAFSSQQRAAPVYASSQLHASPVASARLLGGDQLAPAGSQPEAQFSLKNLQPSTSYELEISAHNAAGHTTAQYEFVTAGPNGTRSGYTRREGVFRLDQRGQPLESGGLDQGGAVDQLGAPSGSLAADSQLANLFLGSPGGGPHGGSSSASIPSQLAPLALTLLCFVCLIISATFCYYRLAESQKRRAADGSRRDSLDDAMRSVCGASSSASCASGHNNKSLLAQNWARTNGLKQQQQQQHQSRANLVQARHAHPSIDDQATPSSTGADSPPESGLVSEHQQQLYQHFCSAHESAQQAGQQQQQQQQQQQLVSSATLNPKSLSFTQSVSMKDFNLIPPLGGATLNLSSSRHQRGLLGNAELAKMGASATMARGRLFEHSQAPLTYGPVASNESRLCSSGAYGTCGNKLPKQTQYGSSGCPAFCGAELEGGQQSSTSETSWTTGANGAHTTYAIPANAYANQNYSNGQRGEHIYPCETYGSLATAGQSNIDACIQHLMSQQQQQYSTLLMGQQKQEPNRCGLYGANGSEGAQAYGHQGQQLTTTSFGAAPAPQSVIESSSSSSGIGADLSANLHLDCGASSAPSSSAPNNQQQQQQQQPQSGYQMQSNASNAISASHCEQQQQILINSSN